MSNNTVTILGATGFVGVRLATLLNARGYNIKALTRHKSRHNQLLVLSNVELLEIDTHDQALLTNAFSGSSAVINLVGILNEQGQTTHTFNNAHVELTKKVVNACKEANVSRYLHMSALHANAKQGSSEYLKSKGIGENIAFEMAGSKLTVTSFRPSVIFGEEDLFFNRFASLLKLLPWFPLACSNAKLAPVYVGDVCKKIVEALENSSYSGEHIDLVGPNDYSLFQLVKFTADTIGVDKPIVRLPDWASQLQAKIMEWVPGKPFSMDNYQSLQTDSTIDDETAKQATSIEAIVPRYIGNKNRNQKFQTLREYARR